MFHDAQEELKRLEAELLAEEAPAGEPEDTPAQDDLLDEESLDALLAQTQRIETPEGASVYQNYSNDFGKNLRNYASGYRAYNTDRTDEDLEEFSQQVYSPKKKGLAGLVITALLLTAAIFAVLCYLVLRFGGSL